MTLRQLAAASLVAVASVLAPVVDGQIGVSTCSCVPRKYTITFDFEGECGNDQNVAMDRPGLEVQCVVLGEGSHVTDFKPVVVTAVDAVELTADLDKVSQSSSPLAAEFNHGDTFDTSSTLMSNEVTALSESTVPTMIQLSILGKNAAGEEIVNVWAIKLSSDCSGAGMLQTGDSVGWAVLSAVEEPLSDLCPSARVALGGPDDAATSDGSGGELVEQAEGGDVAVPVNNETDAVTPDDEEEIVDETPPSSSAASSNRHSQGGMLALAMTIVVFTWTVMQRH